MTATVDEQFQSTNETSTHVVLPEKLSRIKKASCLPSVKLGWNSNEVLLSILISFDKHKEWFTDKIPSRPPNGSMFLINRHEFRDYRRDGYTWKKRTKSTTTREDHFKLKVQGIDCISVLYTHSDVIPTFHKRFYWLIQNPSIILIHYVNVMDDLTGSDTLYNYVTSTRKEDVLSEVTSIYSGIDEQSIPEVQVIEDVSDPPSPVAAPPSPSIARQLKSNEKTFKVCITPKIPPTASLSKVKPTNQSTLPQGNATQWVLIPHKGSMPCIGTFPNAINTWIIPGTQPNIYATTSSINVPIGYPPGAGILIPKQPIATHDQHLPNDATNLQTDFRNFNVQPLNQMSPNNNPTFLVSASLAHNAQKRTVREDSHIRLKATKNIAPKPSEPQQCSMQGQVNANMRFSRGNGSSASMNREGAFSCNSTTATVSSQTSSFASSGLTNEGVYILNNGICSAQSVVSRIGNGTTEGSLDGQHTLRSPSTGSISSHGVPVEPSTSPSSDYGSFISDAGPRLTRSESLSDQGGSREGIFDGPFRIPPSPLENTQVLTTTSRDPSGQKRPFSQAPNGSLEDDPLGPHNLADLGFDVSELSPFESFGDGMLSNYDLNSVFPDFLDSLTGEDSHEQTLSRSDHSNPIMPSSVSSLAQQQAINTSPGQSDTLNSQDTCASSKDVSTNSTCTSVTCQGQADVVMTISSDEAKIVSATSDSVTAQNTSSKISPRHPGSTCGTVRTSPASDTIPSNRGPRERVEMNGEAPCPGSSSSTTLTGPSTLSTVPGSARITDYSPEWAYPEGGVKILVTGEWSLTDRSYTCLFDGCSVEATLVQTGVLRCFCPPHEPGLVTLQVACNGFIVSNACVFEYRARDTPRSNASCHEWLTMDESRFKLAMLERLERLESSLGLLPHQGSIQGTDYTNCATFEDRIIRACQMLFTSITQGSVGEVQKPYRGMTLLHLAAALGFARLIRQLKSLVPTDGLCPLRQELDHLRRDEFSCTALMWACGLGHKDAVWELLLTGDICTLTTPDARGRMPLQIARDRGYYEVVDCIEEYYASSPSRQTALFNGLRSDDEDDIAEEQPDYHSSTATPPETFHNNVPSCQSATATPLNSYHSSLVNPTTTPITSYQSSSNVSAGSHHSSLTSFTDRACSPMAVEEESQSACVPLVGVPLSQALVKVQAMINEAELEADLETSYLQTVTGQGQLNPVHEEADLLYSAGSWVSPGGRFRSFSTASSQSSPHTPSSKSSLSPGSPGTFLNSPHPSPTVAPDTKEFHEFLCTSKKLLEKNFSELTLTDTEQRELYQAALIIQEAYRSYKTRRQQREEELQAAILIQNHYRRYKQVRELICKPLFLSRITTADINSMPC
ncbi:calmodulin-binding transcription activator 2 isoform X2 [Nematostella vectensis]|uniref:calmodulin-binding transcription activator 2 isoform X2 n=1 Tax=Nematostella vectensis TaxID=45351 RepID=UPI00138FED38|nr:calmodulin-binding transcription activator 2 isoform X2 [Nematostella vectensis]